MEHKAPDIEVPNLLSFDNIKDEALELERIAMGLPESMNTESIKRRKNFCRGERKKKARQKKRRRRQQKQMEKSNLDAQECIPEEMKLMAKLGLPTSICNEDPSSGEYYVLSSTKRHCPSVTSHQTSASFEETNQVPANTEER
jgi:hypothetical protein